MADNLFSDLTLALPGISGGSLGANSPTTLPGYTRAQPYTTTETEPISTRSGSGIWTGVSSLFNGIATGIGTLAEQAAPIAGQVIAAKLTEPTAAQQQAALAASAAQQGAAGTVNKTTGQLSAKAEGHWLAGVSNSTVVLAVVGVLAISIFAGAMAQRNQ